MLLTLGLVIQGRKTTAMAILVARIIMPNFDPDCLAPVYYNDKKGNEWDHILPPSMQTSVEYHSPAVYQCILAVNLPLSYKFSHPYSEMLYQHCLDMVTDGL